MQREDILAELRDLLVTQFDVDAEKVVPGAKLEDLDIDSIDAVDMLAWMQKLTGKRMAPEMFREVRTIGDIVNEIERQLA